MKCDRYFRKINWSKIVLILTLSSVRCSLVRDHTHEKTIYISDYCPKMKYCPEGSHVMCNLYDPEHKEGPICFDKQKVAFTIDQINELVDLFNMLRSNIALGIERGKDKKLLPRGYGIFRLKWDSELALFAQVLADQCVVGYDMCRATKKFPNPGQISLGTRFDAETWQPVHGSRAYKENGFNEHKLAGYMVHHIIRYIIPLKNQATVKSITNFGSDNSIYIDHYEKAIYGPSTHMGCGISAFKNHILNHVQDPKNRNLMFIVCNFSAQPRKSTSVYNTAPPSDTERDFNRCGCPMGSIEDDDCLCHEVSLEEPLTKPCRGGVDCVPSVVLLPIVTVEDAPPDVLVINEQDDPNPSTDPIAQGIENADGNLEDMHSNNQSIGDGVVNSKEVFNNNQSIGDGVVNSEDVFNNNQSIGDGVVNSEDLFNNNQSIGDGVVNSEDFFINNQSIGDAVGNLKDMLRNNQSIGNAFVNLEDMLSNTQSIGEGVVHLEDMLSNNQFIGNKEIIRKLWKMLDLSHSYPTIMRQSRPASHSNSVTVRSRYIDKPIQMMEYKDSNISDKKRTQNSSVFSKTPVFEQPGSHSFLPQIIRDVMPQKTIFNGKKLIERIYNDNRHKDKYQHRKENVANNINVIKSVEIYNGVPSKEHENHKNHNEEVHFHDILTTEPSKLTNHRNGNVVNLLQDVEKYDRNKMSEDNDKKLMAFINNSEKEVKLLDVGKDEKQIFDAQIKKIYGKDLGKKNDVLMSSNKHKSTNYNNAQDDDYTAYNLPYYETNNGSNFTDELSFQNKFNADSEIDDNDKTYIIDIEQDKFDRPRKQETFNFHGKNRYVEQNIKFEQRKPNHLRFLESMQNRYNNKFKTRNTFINYLKNNLGKLKYRTSSLDYKKNKNIYRSDIYEDILSAERMTYYQDKLENMNRKLQNARFYNRRKDIGYSPQMRALKAPSPRRSNNQMNPLYTGPADVFHGY